MMISRRRFLVQAGALAASSVFFAHSKPPGMDVQIFRRTMEEAARAEWKNEPINRIVERVGASFVGAPYIAHSLEVPGKERLVVNLRAFDCTTFVESMLALSRCIKRGDASFKDFTRELQRIRYREGIVDGYQSRLHYFIDWVDDNAAKGIVKDVTAELGGTPYAKKIDYMSTHPSAYRQLADSTVLRQIRLREDAINARPHFCLLLKDIPSAEQELRTGDIIGIAAAEAGSDVSHIGIAVRGAESVKFLHAPLSGGKVEFSTGTLLEYLAAHKGRTGIIVVRPLEP